MFLIFNSALKGLDDTPQPKSKAAARWIVVKCNRQKGSTECGYYVMHWMSTIILGSFRNNLETILCYVCDEVCICLLHSYGFLHLYHRRVVAVKIMASPPASPTPPLPSPPPSDSSPLSSIVKQTRKASRLRSLSTRPPGAERPVVHVDPGTGKADGPHRKKLRTYLGIVARDKVDVTYENWKEAEFEIPEASDSKTKKKLLQTVGKRWRQFKSNLTRKWALAADQDGVDDTVYEKYGISKEKWAQFCQTRRDPSWEDVRKKAQAIQKQNTAPHVLSRGDYEYLE
ncbi:hypothetical protein GmHk_07G020019 [Glycine max]|nr:hypothetical protein GmHk_07G020019 [Glycine max]KAH1242762.1 hypothetical protein GmHk_07G020019 [Glycine max]